MPVPGKVTFQERRDTAAKKLDGLAAQGNTLTHELRSRGAVRWQDIIMNVGEIATTQAQRERYPQGHAKTSAENWHKIFIYLRRELGIGTDSSAAGTQLAKAALRLIESTRFGRVLRAFSEEHSVAVPRALISALEQLTDGAKKQKAREKLNSLSVQGIQISPDLIPNRFVQALGWVVWARGTTPWRAIQIKNDPEIIDGVKGVLDSLQQVSTDNTRLWRVEQATPETKLRYPVPKAIHPSSEGTFLYFRGDDASQPRTGAAKRLAEPVSEIGFKREIFGYFTSVYALYRATLHKHTRYEQEISALAALSQTAETLNTRLATDWRRGTSVQLRQQMKGEIVELLERAAPVFEGSKHLAKRDARELLEKIQEALKEIPKNEDTVIQNISSLLAQIVALRNRLAERGADIPRKNKYNTEDQNHLQEYIKKQEQAFLDLHESIERAPRILGQDPNFFDPTHSLTDPQLVTQSQDILAALNLKRERLESVTARPLLTFAKAMRIGISELENAVKQRNKARVESALVKLVVLSKLAQANACLERLKRFTGFCNVSFETFEQISTDLLKVLEKRTVFPNRSVPEYQQVYTPIQRKFATFARRFGELSQQGLSDDQRIVKYGEIREYLDRRENDLERVVAGLVGLELLEEPESEDSV